MRLASDLHDYAPATVESAANVHDAQSARLHHAQLLHARVFHARVSESVIQPDHRLGIVLKRAGGTERGGSTR